MIQINIIGNLGGDAELRYTPQGVAVCDFSVAVTEKFGKGDQRKEKTTWFKVTIWREFAETMSSLLRKGQKVYVSGTAIEAEAYTSKTGEARAALHVTARDIKLLSPKDQTEGEAQPAAATEETADMPF